MRRLCPSLCPSLWKTVAIAVAIAASLIAYPQKNANAADYVVYSVYKALDMGNAGEVPQKDYYVNMGRAQGLAPGSVIKVYRRVSTYDLLSEKLYKDLTFPIGTLKVIYSEPNAAVARLEKLVPDATAPLVSPRSPMIGDIVRYGD